MASSASLASRTLRCARAISEASAAVGTFPGANVISRSAKLCETKSTASWTKLEHSNSTTPSGASSMAAYLPASGPESLFLLPSAATLGSALGTNLGSALGSTSTCLVWTWKVALTPLLTIRIWDGTESLGFL